MNRKTTCDSFEFYQNYIRVEASKEAEKLRQEEAQLETS